MRNRALATLTTPRGLSRTHPHWRARVHAPTPASETLRMRPGRARIIFCFSGFFGASIEPSGAEVQSWAFVVAGEQLQANRSVAENGAPGAAHDPTRGIHGPRSVGGVQRVVRHEQRRPRRGAGDDPGVPRTQEVRRRDDAAGGGDHVLRNDLQAHVRGVLRHRPRPAGVSVSPVLSSNHHLHLAKVSGHRSSLGPH